MCQELDGRVYSISIDFPGPLSYLQYHQPWHNPGPPVWDGSWIICSSSISLLQFFHFFTYLASRATASMVRQSMLQPSQPLPPPQSANLWYTRRVSLPPPCWSGQLPGEEGKGWLVSRIDLCTTEGPQLPVESDKWIGQLRGENRGTRNTWAVYCRHWRKEQTIPTC